MKTQNQNGKIAPMHVIDMETADLDVRQVEELAKSIDIYSLASISDFGSEVADRSMGHSEDLLKSARLSDLDDTGEKLNEIVLVAREFNLDAIEDQLSRKPVLGGLFKRFAMTREKAMAQFDSVKDQIDKLVVSIDSTAGLLNVRSEDYQDMYDKVRADYARLGMHVAAIKMRLSDIEDEKSRLGTSGDDPEKAEVLSLLEANHNVLQKRSDDLEVLRHAALQTLPTVRVIQFNNQSLIDKFNTIQRLTLPSWKRSFLLALAMDEQRGAVELANTVDNATNEFMKRNADLLHQNAVSTAKSNQRLVVDIETLRHVHNKIIDTLEDVREAHLDGAAKRSSAIGELENLRRAMAQGKRAVENVAAE